MNLCFKEAGGDEIKYLCGHLLHPLTYLRKKLVFYLNFSISFQTAPKSNSKYQGQQNHYTVIPKKSRFGNSRSGNKWMYSSNLQPKNLKRYRRKNIKCNFSACQDWDSISC